MTEKHKSYTIDELASDESFIKWVKGLDGNDMAVWEKWLKENPSKKEDVESAAALVKSVLLNQESVSEEEKTELWDKIDGSIRQNQETIPPKTKVSWMKPALWAAAATIAFFLIFKPFSGKEFSIYASQGEFKETVLPDNSRVTLNADSEIAFYPKKWNKGRDIQLDGEAFFNVQKGQSFVVHTKNGEVEVLGTSFNVKSRGEAFEVFCKTGKVKVSTKSGRFESTLTPGQSVVLTANKSLDRTEFNSDEPIQWMKGNFNFEGELMSNVFEEFERQFDVEIISNASIDTMRYTGSFNKGSMNKALNDITWPMGLESEIQNKKITVSKK